MYTSCAKLALRVFCEGGCTAGGGRAPRFTKSPENEVGYTFSDKIENMSITQTFVLKRVKQVQQPFFHHQISCPLVGI
jgi:hypothetical protein